MVKKHNLGFPKIGEDREWKKTIEAYWASKISLEELLAFGKKSRQENWKKQADAGQDFVTLGDFNYYDQVLNLSMLLGVVPKRFPALTKTKQDYTTLFLMARGQAPGVQGYTACEMTKWFDTNYHYIVPEFAADQNFAISFDDLFQEIEEAKALGYNPKPVLLGPVSYLWLGKTRDQKFSKLSLLDKLLKAYQEVLQRFEKLGVQWVQIDEPIFSLELEKPWQEALEKSYSTLKKGSLKILLANYFGSLDQNLELFARLPVDGVHVDLTRSQDEYKKLEGVLAKDKVLSLGIIDGRNIWLTDWEKALAKLSAVYKTRGDKLWIAPSCSLLHSPVSKKAEKLLDAELLSWLSFSQEKLEELRFLQLGLTKPEDAAWQKAFQENKKIQAQRKSSTKVTNPKVQQAVAASKGKSADRKAAFPERMKVQQELYNFPLLPTTTIGSFPQTEEIRKTRRLFKAGKVSAADYEKSMKAEIVDVVQKQTEIGLDVLVHGEPERNDMVEYFGEMLEGYLFTENGWVQSYGTRCVKPPVIFGDISRSKPMTVDWSVYAQSLTAKKMKGMLTGPVTMLCWSFVRDDMERKEVALQLALSLGDEVLDLEKAGITVIQIDEPAIREGLPLKKSDWPAYLDWAVHAFKVSAKGVQNTTQIHTHMCYSEFNEIFSAITAMDADVISIEASRSNFEILDAVAEFKYPNQIGPGIYDIHSPNVPEVKTMVGLLHKAVGLIPKERLWVNPDCGLKTRKWVETIAALKNMVEAAKQVRKEYGS